MRMPEFINYYAMLGVAPDADREAIRRQYLHHMQVWRQHPDLGGDHQHAARLNAAYETLRDPRRRAQYDHLYFQKFPPSGEVPPDPNARRATRDAHRSYTARYFDGQRPVADNVTVRVHASGLEILRIGHDSLHWPIAQLRLTQGEYADEHIRIEFGDAPTQVLTCSNHALLEAIHAQGRARAAHLHDPASRGARPMMLLVMLMAIPLFGWLLFRYGLPATAKVVAQRVPVAWEEKLGHEIMHSLTDGATMCRDAQLTAAVTRLVDRLAWAAGDPPYHFNIQIVKSDTVNAMAAPGGSIIVYTGLLTHTKSPEELAGVLAHEMAHVLHRHGTQTLLHEVSASLLLSALLGNASGAMQAVMQGASVLNRLRYTRDFESQADASGMQLLLTAHVNPNGMIDFFDRMQSESGSETSPALHFLASHPDTADRVENLRTLAQHAHFVPGYFGTSAQWQELVAHCE